MTMTLRSRVDEIDVQVERVRRLIESASAKDPELAAGLATGEKLGNVQRKIDAAAAACEEVDFAVRDFLRNKG